MPPELRAYIEAAGFDPDEISDAQIEHFRGRLAASIKATSGAVAVRAKAATRPRRTAAQQAAIDAEALRCQQIVSLCGQGGGPTVLSRGRTLSLAAFAVERGWSAQQTRRELAVRVARGE